MVREISDSLKNNLKKRVNKLEKEVWIDWDEDGTKQDDELIQDDVLSLMIDKKMEGNLGVSVVDRATIDIDNHNFNFSPKNLDGDWGGYVAPSKNVEINLGVDGESINVFGGILKNIESNYNDFNGSLTVDDKILLLQEQDAPNKFYAYEKPENIIEEFLKTVGIDKYDLTPTTFTINYNFDGMKMWEAIKKINEATQGVTYLEDDTFYYKARLSSAYQGFKKYTDSIAKLDTDYSSETVTSISVAYLDEDISSGEKIYISRISDIGMTYELTATDNVTATDSSTTIPIEEITLHSIKEGSTIHKELLLEEQSIVSHTFHNKQHADENVWEISEELGKSEMYNKVVVETSPYKKQSKQIIWTGENPNTETTEQYEGSDIDSNNELQLIYTPQDSNTSEPTKNVPMVKDKISVINLTDETAPELKDKDDQGIDSDATDYENGIIKFMDTTEYPKPADNDVIQIQYTHFQNKLKGGKERTFIANLDYPSINIEPLIVSAEALESSDGSSTYDTEGSFEEFDSHDFGYDKKSTYVSGFSREQASTLKINLTSATMREDETIDYDYTIYYRKKQEVEWTKKVEDNVRVLYATEAHSLDVTCENLFPSQYEVKVVIEKLENVFVQATFYDDITTESHYYSKGEKVPISFEDSSAPIYIEQNVRDNQKNVDINIKNNTSNKVRLFSEQAEEEYSNFLLKGEPFKQNNNLKRVKKDQDSVDGFGVINSHSIKNDLIQTEKQVKEIVNRFLWGNSTPKSKIELKANPTLHLQLGDYVELDQANRDIDNIFTVKSIRHEINESNEWDIFYNLVQTKPSDWTYLDDGTPIFSDKPEDDSDEGEPPSIIPQEDINLEEIGEQLPDGTYIPSILVEWIKPQDNFVKAHIYYRFEDDKNYEKITETRDNKAKIKVLKKGIHYVKILSENKNGNINELINVPENIITIKGKTEEPKVVDFDQIIWNADNIKITWHPPTEDDYEEVEIRIDDADFGNDY